MGDDAERRAAIADPSTGDVPVERFGIQPIHEDPEIEGDPRNTQERTIDDLVEKRGGPQSAIEALEEEKGALLKRLAEVTNGSGRIPRDEGVAIAAQMAQIDKVIRDVKLRHSAEFPPEETTPRTPDAVVAQAETGAEPPPSVQDEPSARRQPRPRRREREQPPLTPEEESAALRSQVEEGRGVELYILNLEDKLDSEELNFKAHDRRDRGRIAREREKVVSNLQRARAGLADLPHSTPEDMAAAHRELLQKSLAAKAGSAEQKQLDRRQMWLRKRMPQPERPVRQPRPEKTVAVEAAGQPPTASADTRETQPVPEDTERLKLEIRAAGGHRSFLDEMGRLIGKYRDDLAWLERKHSDDAALDLKRRQIFELERDLHAAEALGPLPELDEPLPKKARPQSAASAGDFGESEYFSPEKRAARERLLAEERQRREALDVERAARYWKRMPPEEHDRLIEAVRKEMAPPAGRTVVSWVGYDGLTEEKAEELAAYRQVAQDLGLDADVFTYNRKKGVAESGLRPRKPEAPAAEAEAATRRGKSPDVARAVGEPPPRGTETAGLAGRVEKAGGVKKFAAALEREDHQLEAELLRVLERGATKARLDDLALRIRTNVHEKQSFERQYADALAKSRKSHKSGEESILDQGEAIRAGLEEAGGAEKFRDFLVEQLTGLQTQIDALPKDAPERTELGRRFYDLLRVSVFVDDELDRQRRDPGLVRVPVAETLISAMVGKRKPVETPRPAAATTPEAATAMPAVSTAAGVRSPEAAAPRVPVIDRSKLSSGYSDREVEQIEQFFADNPDILEQVKQAVASQPDAGEGQVRLTFPRMPSGPVREAIQMYLIAAGFRTGMSGMGSSRDGHEVYVWYERPKPAGSSPRPAEAAVPVASTEAAPTPEAAAVPAAEARPESGPAPAASTETTPVAPPTTTAEAETKGPSREVRELTVRQLLEKATNEQDAKLATPELLRKAIGEEALNTLVRDALGFKVFKNFDEEREFFKNLRESSGLKQQQLVEIVRLAREQVDDQAAEQVRAEQSKKGFKKALVKNLALYGTAGLTASFVLTPLGGMALLGGIRLVHGRIDRWREQRALKKARAGIVDGFKAKEKAGETAVSPLEGFKRSLLEVFSQKKREALQVDTEFDKEIKRYLDDAAGNPAGAEERFDLALDRARDEKFAKVKAYYRDTLNFSEEEATKLATASAAMYGLDQENRRSERLAEIRLDRERGRLERISVKLDRWSETMRHKQARSVAVGFGMGLATRLVPVLRDLWMARAGSEFGAAVYESRAGRRRESPLEVIRALDSLDATATPAQIGNMLAEARLARQSPEVKKNRSLDAKFGQTIEQLTQMTVLAETEKRVDILQQSRLSAENQTTALLRERQKHFRKKLGARALGAAIFVAGGEGLFFGVGKAFGTVGGGSAMERLTGGPRTTHHGPADWFLNNRAEKFLEHLGVLGAGDKPIEQVSEITGAATGPSAPGQPVNLGAERAVDRFPLTADPDAPPVGPQVSELVGVQPGAEHVQSQAAVLELATIRKGEGVEHALRRQLEADPKNFGFTGDPADREVLHHWSGVRAHEIALEKDFVKPDGTEIRVFHNEKNPVAVILSGKDDVDVVNPRDFDAGGRSNLYQYHPAEHSAEQQIAGAGDHTVAAGVDAHHVSDDAPSVPAMAEAHGHDVADTSSSSEHHDHPSAADHAAQHDSDDSPRRDLEDDRARRAVDEQRAHPQADRIRDGRPDLEPGKVLKELDGFKTKGIADAQLTERFGAIREENLELLYRQNSEQLRAGIQAGKDYNWVLEKARAGEAMQRAGAAMHGNTWEQGEFLDVRHALTSADQTAIQRHANELRRAYTDSVDAYGVNDSHSKDLFKQLRPWDALASYTAKGGEPVPFEFVKEQLKTAAKLK